jgi:hypothetical protein
MNCQPQRGNNTRSLIKDASINKHAAKEHIELIIAIKKTAHDTMMNT